MRIYDTQIDPLMNNLVLYVTVYIAMVLYKLWVKVTEDKIDSTVS